MHAGRIAPRLWIISVYAFKSALYYSVYIYTACLNVNGRGPTPCMKPYSISNSLNQFFNCCFVVQIAVFVVQTVEDVKLATVQVQLIIKKSVKTNAVH